MYLPRADEYNIAVQNPSSCFSDGDLKHGQVQTNNLGLPMPYSGGFTTTYRISNGNFNYAVRCFTREVGHLQSRYQAIDEFIDANKCNYLVEARYLKLGIQVNGKWYPIIKMKWIDGDLLNVYLSKIVAHDKESLNEFLDKFEKFIENLEKDKVAHGDLQHGNIIIKNDKLYLIDYDGFYLPELEKVGTGEIGHPNYQHPKRSVENFDGRIDRFSAITLYLSIKALVVKPELWKKYYNGENILFKREDFLNPENSELFFDLTQIPELQEDTQNFAAICKGNYQDVPTLKDFIYGNAKYPQVTISKPAKPKNIINKDDSDVFGKLYGTSTTAVTTSGGFRYQPIYESGQPIKGETDRQVNTNIVTGSLAQSKSNEFGMKVLLFSIVGLIIGLIALAYFSDASKNSNDNSNNSILITSTPEASALGCGPDLAKSDKTGQCITKDK